MGAFVFLLLIFMFFLGIVQVLTALGILVTTQKDTVRKHLIIYIGGVAGYFMGLTLLQNVSHAGEYPTYAILFFFGGAWSLAIYHLLIMIAPSKLN